MCLAIQWLQNMQTRLPEMFERMESYGFTHSLSDSDMGYIFHKIVGISNQNPGVRPSDKKSGPNGPLDFYWSIILLIDFHRLYTSLKRVKLLPRPTNPDVQENDSN